MYTYFYKKSGAEGWLDISCLINSSRTSIVNGICTKDFKSTTNTASFEVIPVDAYIGLYRQVLEDILIAQSDMSVKLEAKILIDDVIVASGYIDIASVGIQSTKVAGRIKISIRDYIVDLDRKCKVNLVRENVSTVAIVEELLEMAEIYATLNSSDNGSIVHHFVITDDDDNTFRDIIDTLLFELGNKVLYRNPADGSYNIIPVLSTETPTKIVNYLVNKSLSTTSKIWDHDGVMVKYPTVESKADMSMYIDEASTKIEGVIVPAREFYPKDGDVKTTYQEYRKEILDYDYNSKISRRQNRDIDLLYVKDAHIEVSPSDTFTTPKVLDVGLDVNPKFLPRKAQCLLYNNTDKEVTLKQFDIIGTAVYRSAINSYTIPEKPTQPQEYEANYIETDEEAKAFATGYLNLSRYGSTMATWTTTADAESYPVGKPVIVRHKADDHLSQGFTVISTEITMVNGIAMRKYVAIANSRYNQYEGVVNISKPTTSQKTVVKDVQQFYLSTDRDTLKDGMWVEEVPTGSSVGKYLFTRRFIRYIDGTEYISPYYRVGGGEKIIQEYRYSTSSSDPNEDSFNLNYGVYSLFYGAYRLGYGNEPWTEQIPSSSQHENMYLWKRMWNYNISQWVYELLTPVIEEFEIYASSNIYPISRRQTVNPVIFIKYRQKGVQGTVSMSTTEGKIEKDGKYQWKLTIPYQVSVMSIKITATLGTLVREIVLDGVIQADTEPVYLSIQATPPEFANDKRLIAGDYYLTDKGIPQIWTGTEWKQVESLDNDFAHIMDVCAKDWLLHGHDINESVAALFAYFGTVYSDAIITKHLDISGDAKKFHAVIKGEKENNPAVFDVQYDRGNGDGLQTIFKIVPSTGRIFMGRPNADATAPVSGFMYDPATDEIVSAGKKMVIQGGGSARMIDADIQGTANIKNGRFNGLFDCASIYTEERKTKPVTQYLNNTRVQIEDYIKQYHPELWVNDNSQRTSGFIRCDVIGSDITQYIKLSAKVYIVTESSYVMRSEINVSMALFDKNFDPVTYNQVRLLSYFFSGFPGDPQTGAKPKYEQNDISSSTDPAVFYSNKFMQYLQTGWHLGVYSPYGFEVTVYEGGNILRLNVLEAPAQSTIDGMPYGQIYSTADGTLKMSTKNR